METCAAFPPLRLDALDGGEVSLAALWENGPALILVGHSNCDTTRYTLPHLARLAASRGSGVLAVMQDDADGAREALARTGVDGLPVALERPPFPLAQALSITTVPTLYLVAHGGAIEAVSEGFVRADMERFATALGMPGPLFAEGVKVSARRPG